MCRKLIYLMSFVLVVSLVLTSAAEAQLDPNLIGWWKLDEGAGTTFADSSGYGHDGNITDPCINPVEWTADGYKGNALDFTSNTDPPFTFCDASISTGLLNISDATFSCWMNMPTSHYAWGKILLLLGGVEDHSIEPDGAADMFAWVSGVWFGTSGAKLNDDRWHHITVTSSSSSNIVVIYIDGKNAASNPFGSSDSISTVRIGGPSDRGQWRSYGGRLDEVAVFKRALSATEVKNLFWYGPEWALFATNPDPTDEAIVATTDVTLSWTPGESAATVDGHRVYLDPDEQKVIDRSGCQIDGAITTDPCYSTTLELGEIYYWAVDEVNGLDIWEGAVWSFTIPTLEAFKPVPSDGDVLVDPNVTLSWTAGLGAISHDVYLGTSWTDVNEGTGGTYKDTVDVNYYDPGPPLEFDTTYYWRIDEDDGITTYRGDVWSFKTEPNILITDPNLVGWFTFDMDEEDKAVDWSGYGNHGEISGEPLYVAGPEEANAMAFDGVDDVVEVPQIVGNDFTLMAWINTDTAAPEGAGGRDGSGLIWSDHAGGGDHFTLAVLGTKLAFETGPDGNPTVISNRDVVTDDWVHVAVVRTQSSGQVELFIDGSSDIIDTHNTIYVGANPLIAIGANLLDSRYFTGLIDDVRFYDRALTEEELGELINPLKAWGARPANSATDVSRTPTLTWRPGKYAASVAGHRVYFDPNEQKVIDRSGCEVNSVSTDDPCYPIPSPLELGWTYYWAVDEVNGPNTWEGSVWSFTVAEYLVVEDFDSYANTDPDLHAVWKDYFTQDPYTSAEVYVETGAEDANFVRDGNSMRYWYRNNLEPYYSEAYADIADLPSQIESDWTTGDVKALVLDFYGQSGNDTNEQMYVALSDGSNEGVVTYGGYGEDPNDLRVEQWQEWNIDLEDFNSAGVDLTNVARITIGFGDGSAGVEGTVYFENIRLYLPRCVLSKRSADFAKADYAPAGDPAGDCVIDYQEIEIMGRDWLVADYNADPLMAWYELDDGSGTTAADSSVYGNDGTLVGNPQWVAGHPNSLPYALDFNGVADYVDCGNDVSLDITGAITLAAWVDTNDCNNGEHNPYVTKGDQTYGLKHHDSNNIEIFIYDDDDDDWYNARYAVDSNFNGLWHHLAGTYDGSELKLYVDGALEATTAHIGSIATSTYNLNIGRNSQNTGRLYEGLIDDVRIYDKALSQTEIASIMDGGVVSVSHYHPVPSAAELYEAEAQELRAVNFRDFAILANIWLNEGLWP